MPQTKPNIEVLRIINAALCGLCVILTTFTLQSVKDTQEDVKKLLGQDAAKTENIKDHERRIERLEDRKACNSNYVPPFMEKLFALKPDDIIVQREDKIKLGI